MHGRCQHLHPVGTTLFHGVPDYLKYVMYVVNKTRAVEMGATWVRTGGKESVGPEAVGPEIVMTTM